ncbi:unnamed protein product [Ambrosiozyma monospora]|uniref:Nascent polypeptide-associated complex subunit alpha n=1 Tax=Ambrosiozyma monospora TaxID=43982 RepID=A0A9W7DDG4_AMBMO|nr:unnamed protein product [Ambrosiozyma monospora]
MSIEELQEQIPSGSDVRVIGKNEKKARASILKLGLKQIKGITRVTFKRKGGSIVAIEQPEVYKSAGGSYIVFGEAKVEDLTKRYEEAMKAQQAAQQAAAGAAAAGVTAPAAKDPESITADLHAAADLKEAGKGAAGAAAEEDDGEVDESGVDAGDIDIIVEQTNVSRAKAVKALKENKGDMVNAIMSLTT